MRKSISAAAVAAVAAAAVIAPAGAASAKAVAIDDAVSDVWKLTFEKGGGTSYDAVDSVVNADADKSVVSHTDKRISLKVTYKSLKKNQTYPFIETLLKDDTGNEWYLYAYVYQGENGWLTDGFAGENHVISRGEAPACEGIKSDLDLADDFITVSAPRSCFGDPTWVKAHVSAYASKYTDTTSVNYYDNGHVQGHDESKGWTDRIKKG